MAGLLAGVMQQLRAQLRAEEFVVAALLNQQRQAFAGGAHQGDCVPLFPCFALFAEVGGKRLLAPRHLAGRNDRRKRRHAAVAPRVPQCNDQRAVPAHRVAADRARPGGREVRLDQRRQLVDDVVMHPVVRGPRRLRGVDIEARALAQVVALGIGDLVAARAGVGCDQDHAVLGRVTLRAGLGDEVLLVAGEAAEPVQDRQLPRLRLRRQEDREAHRAAERCGPMLVHVLPAAEAGAMFYALHGISLIDSLPPLRGR